MKRLKFAGFALLAAMALSAQNAAALSQDDKSMNTPSGAARFSDPDEQTPTVLNLQGGTNADKAGAVDTSQTRYDYDPTSGTYVVHSNSQ